MSSTVTVPSICPNYRKKQRNGSLCVCGESKQNRTPDGKKRDIRRFSKTPNCL